MYLRTRIKAILHFRIAFLAVMAGSALVLKIAYSESFPDPLGTLLALGFGFGLGSAAIFYFWTKKPIHEKIFSWSQVLWDIGFTSLLVFYTGGLGSIFTILYVINILSSAFLLYTRGALVASGVAAATFWILSSFHNPGSDLNDVRWISRTLFISSALLLFGGSVAFLFKNREGLEESLEKAHANVAELSELQAAVVHHIPSGILYLDENNRVRLMNTAAQNILSLDMIGQDLAQTDCKFMLSEVGARKEQEVVWNSKRLVIGHHRTRIPSSKGSVIVFQDVTEIRDLETQNEVRDKMAAVGQLAAGIAHEIRNPLASLSGSIQLLRKGVQSSDPEVVKLMNIILREADRLDELSKNFLNYAKPSKLDLKETEVHQLVGDLKDLMENGEEFKKRALKVRMQVPENLKWVCDGKQVRQMLWNLAKNAIEVSPQGGAIEIAAWVRSDEKGEPRFILEVRDEGPGLSPEVAARIYDPFFTTKSSGTGLGLTLVYEMVRAHGGSIQFESISGKGTRFWISLPSNMKDHKHGIETRVASLEEFGNSSSEFSQEDSRAQRMKTGGSKV